jgi:hypothetical protein
VADGHAIPDEPFFPCAARYDAINPQGIGHAWLAATTFEAFETWQHFSGCFKPIEQQELQALDWLQSSPFASAAMERRRQLQRLRARLQRRIEAPPILRQMSADHLNPEIWIGG